MLGYMLKHDVALGVEEDHVALTTESFKSSTSLGRNRNRNRNGHRNGNGCINECGQTERQS